MAREILFRGKHVFNGELVQGDLIHGVGAKSGKIYILPIVINLASVPGAHPLDGCQVLPETVGQFTELLDKKGKKIFEGDEVRYRMPYRTTQTHTGDNIPNGSYTEPMEPGIKEVYGIVRFKNGVFVLDTDGDENFESPLSWINQVWDLENIKSAISWTRQTEDWFEDPEEGDLQYLIKEVAKVCSEQELIDYLSGIEIIGNIHDNPELIGKEVPNG